MQRSEATYNMSMIQQLLLSLHDNLAKPRDQKVLDGREWFGNG